jgi:hypothetical protein
VLSDRRLAALRDLPRRTLYDLADPNRAVLETAIKRGTLRADHPVAQLRRHP